MLVLRSRTSGAHKAALLALIYLRTVLAKASGDLSKGASPRPSAMLYGVIPPPCVCLDEAVARRITQG